MTTETAVAAAPAGETPQRRAARGRIDPLLAAAALLPVAAVAVAVVLLGSAPYRVLGPNVPDLGTSLTTAVLQGIAGVAAAACAGGLAYGVLARQRAGERRLVVDWFGDARLAAVSAGVWAVAAAALVAADAADAGGQSLSRLLVPGAPGYLFSYSYVPTAWLVTALLAAAIAVTAFLARTWQTHAALLGVALVAVLPPVVVTQVLVGPNHDFGSDAAIVGTPAAAVLLGLIGVARLRTVAGPLPGLVSLRRTWVLLGLAWAATTATEVVIALFELWSSPFLGSATAWLFLVRFVLLAALAPLIAQGLRASRGATDLAAVRRTSARLVRIALLPAALLLGVALIMARIPPPQYFVPTSVNQTYFGYDLESAPTLAVMLFDWRPNLLFLLVSVVGAGLYVAGVVVLRRRGDAWPVGRTVAWVLGWTVVVLTTSSGLGRYSSAVFSLHMILHMALNMLGPLLLVLGGPITLALRALPAHGRSAAAGVREWIAAMLAWRVTHVLFNPLFVFIRFIGAYYVLYFTPIFDFALRYHWAHQLMNAEFLVVGVMFYGLVIGVDAPPRPIPHIGKLGMVLAAMPFHAFFGVAVMTSKDVIAGDFYRYISEPWAGNLLADQATGGGIAWGAGELPLVIVIVALVTQWARQDGRVAARTDRHLDQGTDDSFEAYNAMLAKLQSRDREPASAAPGAAAAPAAAPERDA
ncbi:cytochrome c oxidase assembly protein [Amnibacterium kyonggiense]|uniref:Putative copper resistance protein D n=1 Tax=Amnibacterium kyonggiense TaxID=595671 RepID=A0A4R7FRX2_9MICO|nr:cytochrome c oxidase assembly protein [Amnibacterium kyonggiense]TDS80488.1 putative copper resistance protein D [Amnibacterium kyonggiense]